MGTLCVGYADGYRQPIAGQSNWVMIDGVVLRVIGDVTMDMCMVDLNPYVKKHGRPPRQEDEYRVILMTDGEESEFLSAEQVSARWGTYWWKLFSGIRTRNESVAKT